MRNKFLICNIVFIFSLLVLFLNDHFLKLYFHNWFTGKLSDAAGIILFPFLLTFLFPKLRQNSVYITGLFFTFWKSSYSEKFIEFYNVISPISIHRVVDYTDLLTVVFLFIPYYLIKNKDKLKIFEINKLSAKMLIVPSVLVLMSTSPPRYYKYVPYTGNIIFSNFSITFKDKSNEDVFKDLKNRNVHFRKDTVRIISENKRELLMAWQIETKNLDSKKQLFEVSQDSLKNDIKNLINNSNWFIIDSIKLEDEMVKNIQFTADDYTTSKSKESVITINGLTTDKNLNDNSVKRKLKQLYRKSILKEFKNY
ncbi:hypothetical protein PQ459_08465 [Chryseobacterium sp. KACC 21268]|nr:hypothetical protein PQ459_08465 [Chryseobacterium sp. KACC 21268]